mgnify:CR=1 FL=1
MDLRQKAATLRPLSDDVKTRLIAGTWSFSPWRARSASASACPKGTIKCIFVILRLIVGCKQVHCGVIVCMFF